MILGERLRPWQWAAVGVGTAAVGVLTWDYGRLPWLALILAFSFGCYGLIKKLVGARGRGEDDHRDRDAADPGGRGVHALVGDQRGGRRSGTCRG